MITLKRGDTFKLDAVVLGDGVVIPGGIGGWTITSQIRTTRGVLIDTLVVTVALIHLRNQMLELLKTGLLVTTKWILNTLLTTLSSAPKQ